MRDVYVTPSITDEAAQRGFLIGRTKSDKSTDRLHLHSRSVICDEVKYNCERYNNGELA